MAISQQALIDYFQKAVDEDWGYIWGAKYELWSEAKQASYAKKYADDPDRKQSVLYGGKWAGHIVTDCSGLFARAADVLGASIHHGSNSMYRYDCSAKGKLNVGKGTRTDGQELLPGTAVFTGTESEHGHVGLYIGDGWVIEAKGASYGVVKSKITEKRWTYWGELKAVSYDRGDGAAKPAPAAEQANDTMMKKPTIRRGSKGEFVTLAQTMLLNRGYQLPKYGADGDFGAETEKAVRLFQQDWGLTVDGVIGPSTWQTLESTPAKARESTWAVTIRGLDRTQAQALVNNYPGAIMAEE